MRDLPIATVLAGGFLVTLILFALAADVLVPYDGFATSLRDRHIPPWQVAQHVLGTNYLGQDALRNLLEASKTSVSIALLAAGMAATAGTALGIAAGYSRSWMDQIVMRVVDIQMAFPALLLAIFVLTIVGTGFANLVVVIALARWPLFARVARGMTLSLREREFIDAARAIGCTQSRIMWRHVLPNLIAGQVTLAVLELSRVMLVEGGLTFLGIGLRPPQITWGIMLATGRDYISSASWEVTLPGAALLLTSLSVNQLASWFRLRTGMGVGRGAKYSIS